MKKAQIFLLLFLSSIAILSACNKKSNKITSDSIVYNNDIFTEDLYNNIIEIDGYYGGENVNITNNEDIYHIYNNLASLTITEIPDNEEQKDGPLIITLVTKDKTIGIGLSSDELVRDYIRYTVDKDIVNGINDILQKNLKKQ